MLHIETDSYFGWIINFKSILWSFNSVLLFRTILLPLVALVGRFLYGISRLPSLQSLSAMMLQLMNLQMVSMVLATYYHWQACVLLTRATICPCTLLKLRDTFQLLPKAIKILFMQWLWMKVEQFLSLVAQKRYNMAFALTCRGFFTFETLDMVCLRFSSLNFMGCCLLPWFISSIYLGFTRLCVSGTQDQDQRL